MQFSIAATLATLAVAVSATPAFTNSNFDLVEGKPFTLTFSGCTSACTVILQNGDSNDLHAVKTVGTGSSSVTFTPSGLPSDTYSFKITEGSEVNYSEQFPYKGTGVAKTTAAAPAVTSAASVPATTLVPATKTAAVVPASTPASNSSLPASTPASARKSKPTSKPKSKTSSGSPDKTKLTNSPAGTVPVSGAIRTTSSLALIAGAVAAIAFFN